MPCEILEPCNVPAPLRDENKIREVSIRELNKGYLVNVGCHSFAITDSKLLIKLLSEYISDPEKTEKKWYDKKLF